MSSNSPCSDRDIQGSVPSRPERLRTLVLLEGKRTSGAVKPILLLARAAVSSPDNPLDITICICIRKGVADTIDEAVIPLGLPVVHITEKRPWDWDILRQLQDVVTSCRPDIIWTHSYKSHFLVRLLGLHRQAKWAATHHGYTREALRTLFYNQLDRWSLRSADLILADCGAHIQQLAGRITARQAVHVQYNPIQPGGCTGDDTASDLRERLNISPDSRIVLTVGRLSAEKGHADLIKALGMRQHSDPGITLVVVGDGPEMQRLTALCLEQQLSNIVRFVGFQEDASAYYSCADLFVLPSLSEGSPNVLLEALDAGVPVVATAVGGVPEVVENGVSAILVPARRSALLAAAVDRVLTDGTLRRQLVSEGRKVVLKHTPDRYFRDISRLFQEVSENGA